MRFKNVSIYRFNGKAFWQIACNASHIHYNQGDLVKSPLQKDYDEQAERAAFMMIRMLDIKVKQKY